MPYLLSSIISISAIFVIFFTRFEADETSLVQELEQMKTMFLGVDSYSNTYIEMGESLSTLNFKVLEDNGILLSNAKVSIQDTDAFSSVLNFPNNDIAWQVIPNIEDESSYKIFVDITASSLMNKVQFSENFIGKEYCEKLLFGVFETNASAYSPESNENAEDWDILNSGDNSDGLFLCVVYK